MENDDTQVKVFPTSRKRSADGQMELDGNHNLRIPAKLRPSMNRNQSSPVMDERENGFPKMENPISERRRALFEPLSPKAVQHGMSAESLLPQPDFESASYPRGWVVGKKRKLVNVDVVESMRRVAVLEMNRKDREIDGLHEQLEEDARCLEHLQHQFLQESSKRADAERENALLQSQITMLMDMLEQNENEQEPVHDHCLPD